MSGFFAVGYFLVSLVFGIVISVLWLRIALRYLRVSTLDPFNRMIQTMTNPLIQPLSRLLSLQYKPSQRYDWLSFSILIIIEIIKICCLSLLVFQRIMPFPYLLMYVVADLIIAPCNLIFYAILLRVILSWTNPRAQYPISNFLYLLTEPFLIFGRTVIPNISGFDFSPFIVMILFEVITLFISASLPWKLI